MRKVRSFYSSTNCIPSSAQAQRKDLLMLRTCLSRCWRVASCARSAQPRSMNTPKIMRRTLPATGTARAHQLSQPLIQLANNAQLQYVLAEAIVPNGSTSNWHIKLRKGVTFHNGKPFGADDVIYTLRTILNPKKPLGGALVLSPVDVNGLKKVDNLTVQVPMKTPFGSFPAQLAAFWYFLYIAPDGWTQKDAPNGTGPFKYKSFTPGQQSVFVRNTNYWKAGLPHLDSVTIIDFQDPPAVQNALVSKAIDCTGQLTGTQMKILQNTSGITAVL